MESGTIEGDSPVRVKKVVRCILSKAGPVKPCLNPRAPSRKAKYDWVTDSEPVLWRKGEKNPEQGNEIDPETTYLQAEGGGRSVDLVPFA